MEAIVTQRLIVNWRKKRVKKPRLQEKEEKHLTKKSYGTVRCSNFSYGEINSHDLKNSLRHGLDPL
jgi:hypothetical protein